MSEAGDKFRQLVEHLPEVVWLLDEDLDETLYTNPAYRRLLETITSEPDWPVDAEELVHPEDTARAAEWFETIQQDIRDGTWNTEYTFEARLTDGTDTEHWLETIGVPIVDDGGVIGFAGISTDVTEQKSRERELETRVDQLDQFVSMITHDIRNPLTVAKANLELYEKTQDRERLERVEEALDRIDELTTDLVALARDGDDSVAINSVDLDAVATKAWVTVDTRDAQLETEPAEIDADASMLQTALENLFKNAVGHGGSDVTVRVVPTDAGFIVEDTGSGISPDLREQVMEHGFTTGYSGTGTGLTIVQRIADEHGWDIDLGESPEGGARFEFHPC
ncbi:Signal transduction histidine kinase [Halanaeroarchaeum sp. HSR-CO]|uniref:PAS domain-containing sensor histidine kinase n=1 Tax=Halanaeroarchaeum sp. HSR-CO TaxID=2866382 RepID=UPI00217E48B7|nr:PAS domain-containing sensor histidine kinase [Halanaeroarchaeum sp. HSR-CO]UWG47538.1 Signal transduction histidine kinase [Halanaeroarchaeum sp. HSR-CO]